MANDDKTGPNRKIVMSIPRQLLEEADRLLVEGDTPYASRSDMIRSALREEVRMLQRKKMGLIMTAEQSRWCDFGTH
jgi:metal-responsive CopG/Arc/MetJ family transcriptional regulator